MYWKCEVCGQSCPDESHVCDREQIVTRITALEKRAVNAESETRSIREHIKSIVASQIHDEHETTERLLQQLWDAMECGHYRKKDMTEFSESWRLIHWNLAMSMQLFSSRRLPRINQPTILERLSELFAATMAAAKQMGYLESDKKMDVTPEHVLKQLKS